LDNIIEAIKSAFLLWTIFSTMACFHLWFYNKNPKYYFFLLKIMSRWRDTNWHLNVSYELQKDDRFYEKFEHLLEELYGRGNYTRSFNLKNKKLYEFKNLTLIIEYDLDVSHTDKVEIDFHFNNVNVTYQGAMDMLNILNEFFNRLERTFTFDWKNYSLKIKFTSMHNPFYGLLIQRIGAEHVKHFECFFSFSALEARHSGNRNGRQNMISVYKDYISINDEEFDCVAQCAKKCLLMG